MNDPDEYEFRCRVCGHLFVRNSRYDKRSGDVCDDCRMDIDDVKAEMKLQERRDGER